MESNGQDWVRMIVGLLVVSIKAFYCQTFCGSGILTIESGREFQSAIVRRKSCHNWLGFYVFYGYWRSLIVYVCAIILYVYLSMVFGYMLSVGLCESSLLR